MVKPLSNFNFFSLLSFSTHAKYFCEGSSIIEGLSNSYQYQYQLTFERLFEFFITDNGADPYKLAF